MLNTPPYVINKCFWRPLVVKRYEKQYWHIHLLGKSQKHGAAIQDLALSPDGTWIISISSEDTAQTWQIGEDLGIIFDTCGDPPISAVFFPDGATITEPPFCNWTLLDFSCPFLILPSLRNYRDMGEMSLCLCLKFYLKTFCPLFVVIACRRFWTDLFAILWQRAEPPNSKSDGAIPKQVASRPGETETRTRFARLWSGEWKFLWRQRVLLLRRRRPSSSGNFALISLGTYIWHIGYLIKWYEYNCNKIRDARLCRVPSRSNNTF
jgi:hypothetical protein